MKFPSVVQYKFCTYYEQIQNTSESVQSFKHTCNITPLTAGNSGYFGDEFGPRNFKLEGKSKGTKGNQEYSMNS